MNSRIPVKMSNPPKSFSSREVFRLLLQIEKSTAEVLPAIIAGSTFLISRVPCFQRNNEAITADGIKYIKLINLASACGIPAPKASQRINKLPPPVPKPDKNPNVVPIKTEKENSLSTNIAILPTISICPICDATIVLGFCVHTFLQDHPQWRCPVNRGGHLPMADRILRKPAM